MTVRVFGNDGSDVGSVSRELERDGVVSVMTELAAEFVKLGMSEMLNLVLQKAALHDTVSGVSPDKLAEGLAAMQEYKERTSGERQQPGPEQGPEPEHAAG